MGTTPKDFSAETNALESHAAFHHWVTMIAEFLTSLSGRTLVAFILASAMALLAYRAHALSPSGAAAAVGIGTLVAGGGDWWCGLLLVLFFVTSSALSLIGKRISPSTSPQRGSRRDAVQVVANGGVAAFVAVLIPFWGSAALPIALVTSLAAANADTWATEIGRLSGAKPRLVTTMKRVSPGRSGAISTPGTLAALGGALTIGLVAALGIHNGAFEVDNHDEWLSVTIVVTAAGFAGCLLDSLLGATVQAHYHADNSAAANLTERSSDPDTGLDLPLARGIRWMTNDTVNALAIAFAGLVAGTATAIIGS